MNLVGISVFALPLEQLTNNLDYKNTWSFGRVFTKLTAGNSNKPCKLSPQEKQYLVNWNS